MRPGQFVRVVLKGAQRPDAITVPQRAVMEGPTSKMVYVLGAESKAEPRPVQLGEWTGKNEVVVLSGLKAGDKVITDGLMKVFPGATVQVGDPNAPPPGAPGKAGPSPQPSPTPRSTSQGPEGEGAKGDKKPEPDKKK